MRSEILTIMKKEFRRFFTDKRLVFSSIILPGLLIYIIYSIMGNVIADIYMPDEAYQPKIAITNEADSTATIFGAMGYTYEVVDVAKAQEMKDKVKKQELDAYVVFPEDFDAKVMAYEKLTATDEAPEIEIYYNSAAKESEALFKTIQSVYDQYEASLINKFDINRDPEVKYDLASEKDMASQIFMMVPMLLIMMLMSGCMSVAPDAIAGEKERGTMATLLVTPVNRSSIALGKVISLSVFALLSGMSSTIGVLASLPKLMGGGMNEINAFVYETKDYVCLAIGILSLVLAIISIFAIISTYAKTTKEAASLSSPVMILGIVLGVTSSLIGDDVALGMFTVPVYNSAILFKNIFAMNYTTPQVAITTASNLVFVLICVWIMTKMFNSEKVMFAR